MGNISSRISSCFQKQQPEPSPRKVLLMGLDAAGKTTILYSLNGKVKTSIPTIGFNVETLNLQGMVMTAWDVGGRDKIRPLQKHFYKGTDGVVFVVDSNDHERMEYAKKELQILVNETELKELPVLLVCNKQDLPNAKSASEMCELFRGVFASTDKWKVAGCSATTGEGVHEGFAWLGEMLAEKMSGADNQAKNESDVRPIFSSETESLSSTESTPMATLGYVHDPSDKESNLTLQRFDAIKRGTNCPFAKASKLWGGPNINGLSLEDQAKEIAAPLTEFVRRSDIGNDLDGFCIELDDPMAREGGPKDLGECVRKVLTVLSDLDPAHEHMMRVNYIGERGWRFRFGRADFFVTTFAPCYPFTSSRYAFGTPHAFILLQPEASFARHNLPPDTAITHWDNPKTVRDKTRGRFTAAGRGYYIPNTTRYPPAEHIVKPIEDDGATVVRWWQDDESRKPRH